MCVIWLLVGSVEKLGEVAAFCFLAEVVWLTKFTFSKITNSFSFLKYLLVENQKNK